MHYHLFTFLCLLIGVNAYSGMIDKGGMAPWEVCALCHSLNGVSVMDKFPKLAGQKSAYIKKQFWDFHNEHRTNDGGQMQAITTEVEPESVDAIAEYFESLTPSQAMSLAGDNTKSYELGKALFHRGKGGIPACVSCHGNTKSLAPWLYAQHGNYLIKQLEAFRSDSRENDKDAVMRDIAKALTDADIKAIAVYLESTQLR